MYFFDTYALIEIATGNQSYKNYLDFPYVVSALNIGEFYSYLIRTHGTDVARQTLEPYLFEAIKITRELVLEATEFKIKNARKKLSWADCIGYLAARQLGLKFLTGDSDFKGLPDVEFVK